MEQVRAKRGKRLKPWVYGMLIIIIATMLLGWYMLQKPKVAKEEFVFQFGEELPTNSDAYFTHNFRYEDEPFDASLFAMSDIGSYDVDVSYAGQTYTLHIVIADKEAPEITFSKEEIIHVYRVNGKLNTSSMFEISDISDFTYEMTPSLDALRDGPQEVCVSAKDAYSNEQKSCATLTLALEDVKVSADVNAKDVEEIVKNFIKEKNLNTRSFGFFYYDPTTKEEFVYGGETTFLAASTIKVPLNMVYYDKINAGEINLQSTIQLLEKDIEAGAGLTTTKYKVGNAVPLSFVLEQSIVNSDNTATNMLTRNLGGFNAYRKAMAVYAFNETHLPSTFYIANDVNAMYMLDVLKYLYAHSSSYTTLLEDMKQACAGEYLQSSTRLFEIAQKYGLYDTYEHAIGIVYTPEPYIVGMYTNGRVDAQALIKELNQRLIAYQLTR